MSADAAPGPTEVKPTEAPAGDTGPSAPEQLIYVIAYHENWHGLDVRKCKSKDQIKGVISEVLGAHDPDTWAEVEIRVIHGIEMAIGKPKTALVVDLDGAEHVLFSEQPPVAKS